jgi:hypothetical protein
MDTYVQLILYLMILIQSQAVYLVSFKINKLQTNDNLHKSEGSKKHKDKTKTIIMD